MKHITLKHTIIFLVASAILFFADWSYVRSLQNMNNDFFTFWLAGRMIWTGENPYSHVQWIAGRYEYGVNWVPDPIFPYPIPLSIVMIPIGLLPVRAGFVLWLYFAEIAIILSVFLLMSSSTNDAINRSFVPVLAGTFLFRPVLLTLGNGQFSAFILLNLVLILWLWKREKWWQGGCLLALLWLKPTVGGPIIALLCLYLWKQGHKKSLAAFSFLVLLSRLSGLFRIGIGYWIF